MTPVFVNLPDSPFWIQLLRIPEAANDDWYSPIRRA